MYVGVMGPGFVKPVVAWTAPAILQSMKEVLLDPASLDAHWMLVAYHNSRREVGRALSFAAKPRISPSLTGMDRTSAVRTAAAAGRRLDLELENE